MPLLSYPTLEVRSAAKAQLGPAPHTLLNPIQTRKIPKGCLPEFVHSRMPALRQKNPETEKKNLNIIQ